MNITNTKKAGIISIASLVSAGTLLAQSSDSADNSSQVGVAIGGAIGGLLALIFAIIGVIVIIGMWKIFVKAGEPGWAAIIPIYNIYIICKITAKPIWWLILLVVCPPVGFVILILLTVALAKAFGKGAGFAIGMILLPFVFYPMLGFGTASYTAPPPQN